MRNRRCAGDEQDIEFNSVLIPDDCDIVGFGPAHQVEPEHTVERQGTVEIAHPNANVNFDFGTRRSAPTHRTPVPESRGMSARYEFFIPSVTSLTPLD
jgi:hypothetical protein